MTSRSHVAFVLLLMLVGAQPIARASAEGPSWISARLVTGGVVDTNPFFLPAGDRPTGLGPTIGGHLLLRTPWDQSRHQAWGSLSGSRIFYYEGSSGAGDRDVSEVNTTALRALAFYEYRPPWAGDSLGLSVGYDGGLILLDGYAPLADDNHIFVESHAGWLRLHRVGKIGVSGLSYRLVRQSFADQVRTNWGNELALEHSLDLWQRRVWLSGWLSVRYERAQIRDYDSLTPQVDLAARALGPLGLELGLALGFAHENHFQSADGQWGKQRLDNRVDFKVELGRALAWGLDIQASYRRLQNLSTLQTFEYTKNVVLLSLSWSFPWKETRALHQRQRPWTWMEMPALQWRQSTAQVEIEGVPRL